MERSPTDGGDDATQGFSIPAYCRIALQHLLAYVKKPKACHYQILSYNYQHQHSYEKLNNIIDSVAWVHKQTIPTEQPQLVAEVSANFYG
jgi:hypothetical protein